MKNSVENKVQAVRQKKGLTQAQLAASCDVTRQTIIAIEKGKYVPSVALALKLALALNKNVEEIFWL